MSSEILTVQNILFAITIMTLIFGIYKSFKNPQIQSEKEDALLTQQVAELIKTVTNLSSSFQAHVLADQTSFSLLNQHVVEVDKSVVRLTTIIDERIPKK